MRQWGKQRRLRRVASLLLVSWISLPVMAQQASAPSEDGLQCKALEGQQVPATAEDWFMRSRLASHCYVYQARAVRIGASGVRTLALSHDVQDGVEREVARFMDGPPVVHERRGGIPYLHSNSSDKGEGRAVANAQQLEAFYRLRMAGEARIAGRSAHILEIEPLDDKRYGRRLWLDADSALPLKQVLLDERGRAMETFQMTELRDPQLYQGSIDQVDRTASTSNQSWRPGWLPKGFEFRGMPSQQSSNASADQQLYGDGLATLSLFVEMASGQQLLKPGLHRLGASHAAVRHRELGDKPRQIVVMGELPPSVLQRVAESVEWQGENNATVSARDSASPP